MTPEPPSGLLRVAACIKLLKYCTSVTDQIASAEQGDLDKDCDLDKNCDTTNVYKVHMTLVSYISGVEKEREVNPPADEPSQKLWHLASRCIGVAKALTGAIEDAITAIVVEHIGFEGPADGWKLVASKYRSRVTPEQDCYVVFHDYAVCLAQLWE